jgi:hypothetical protein
VTEQNLDDPDISTALQKMSGKTVPQRVGRHMLADPSAPPCSATSRLESPRTDMLPGLLTRKQPRTRPGALPIGAQDVQQPRRQHRITILATLGALDVDQHPFAVDRADLQTHNLSDTQARRIGRRQRNAVAQSRNRFQETRDLLTVENRRKLLGFFAGDDPLERLLLAERDAVEEPQGARDLIDVGP